MTLAQRAWLVLPDQLSIRVFFDTGIVEGLSERLGGALAAVFLVPRDEAADWVGRVGNGSVLYGDELTAAAGGPASGRFGARIDAGSTGRSATTRSRSV